MCSSTPKVGWVSGACQQPHLVKMCSKPLFLQIIASHCSHLEGNSLENRFSEEDYELYLFLSMAVLIVLS